MASDYKVVAGDDSNIAGFNAAVTTLLNAGYLFAPGSTLVAEYNTNTQKVELFRDFVGSSPGPVPPGTSSPKAVDKA
jgi:hypothetical protein